MRKQAETIIRAVLDACDPTALVQKAVAELPPCAGRTVLLAVGKASLTMAAAALSLPAFAPQQALVITKHGHAGETERNKLPPRWRERVAVRQAGHPVPDAAGYAATEEAIAMVRNLTEKDRVVLLLSGGGSALFEKPLLPDKDMEAVNRQLLSSGADITAINTIRKRLSAVKGGRFAKLCAPAQVVTIALSDVLGDDPASIASGPAAPDSTTCGDALRIAEKYRLALPPQAAALLRCETPKMLPNAMVQVVGGMRLARAAAAHACKKLGYPVRVFLPALKCEAADAGRFFGALAARAERQGRRLAVVAGGETVVTLAADHGLGGRNQEAALAAATCLRGTDSCFFSLGTDGTDGPTDAAGGYADGCTCGAIAGVGQTTAMRALAKHDAYHALKSSGGLLFTGPTGTNVNDVCVLLVGHGHPAAR